MTRWPPPRTIETVAAHLRAALLTRRALTSAEIVDLDLADPRIVGIAVAVSALSRGDLRLAHVCLTMATGEAPHAIHPDAQSVATRLVARVDHGSPLWTLLTAVQSGRVTAADLQWVAHKVRVAMEVA